MVDIMCCKWLGCNLKKHCYRFTAPKNPYQQSYFVETPKLIKDKECEYFVANTDYFRSISEDSNQVKKELERIWTPEIDPDVKLPF